MAGDGRRLAIDVIVPLYNEEASVAEFHRQLMAVVTPLRRECDVRICYVDDGSVDGTAAELAKLCADDPEVSVLPLSRNFGHQAALTAGLDRARGDAAVMLDGDGQHPPELIPEMVALYRAGYDVVLTQRAAGPEPPWRRWRTRSRDPRPSTGNVPVTVPGDACPQGGIGEPGGGRRGFLVHGA